MKQVDTLIVGFGLAGLAYAETLRKNQRTFHVIDQALGGSSVIAAGIYNPTVLKRFNMTWHGEEFHSFSLPFYKQIEERLSIEVLFPLPICKVFSQPADHNQWMVAADRKGLATFLEPHICQDSLTGVKLPFGYAKVNHCGRLNTAVLIQAYKDSLAQNLTTTSFDYSQLALNSSKVIYGDIEAKQIVFCEGYEMTNNPFFKALPIVGSKGQILIIHAPALQQEVILKGPIFIAPLGKDTFWAGASFEQQDKSLSITAEGKEWLTEKVNRMIDVPYTVVKQITQIRPTVKDRRPLLGTHPQYKNIHLLNGMGSRGVLTAPLAANWLFKHIEGQENLPKEVDIQRFEKMG